MHQRADPDRQGEGQVRVLQDDRAHVRDGEQRRAIAGSDEDESVATKEKISIAASRVPTSGEQANVRFSEVFAFLTKLKGGAGGSDATDVVLNLHSELEGTDADGGAAALQKKRGGGGSAPSVTKRAKRRSTAPTAPDSEDEEE